MNYEDFRAALFFSETPPPGYERRLTSNGVLFRPAPPARRGRWDFMEYPVCRVEQCQGCGNFFPEKAIFYGSFPQTRRDQWLSGRQVCFGCRNRHEALMKRYEFYREIKSLIAKLEREITNARKKAA